MVMHPDRAAQASTSNHIGDGDGMTRGSAGRGRGRGGRGASAVSRGFPGSIPTGSISKLKAQLRQTKRLLTRDDLTPDVRITSERRLKTLELELEKTTNSELEKKMVTRYRGIKFFERQKVLRKIKQTKKGLLTSLDDPTLLATLHDSRIDLYYIIQYPKTEKYVALFPEGTYAPHSTTASTDKRDGSATRSKLRDAIRKRIIEGTLSVEAESGDLGIEGEEDVVSGPAGEIETGSTNAVTSTPATVVSIPEVSGLRSSTKRSADEEAPSTEIATSERKIKKTKSVVEETTSIPIEVEVVEEVEEKEKRGMRETKKEKKDRKDALRKKKKGGEAEEAVASVVAPALVNSIAPISVPVVEEKIAGSEETAEEKVKKALTQTKKEKKDRKDALRKQKKGAGDAGIVVEAVKEVAVKSDEKAAEKAPVENWAEEDDFFQ